MKIISYLDNDQINRPATGSLPVYALDITTAITKEQLIKQHPRVFGPGIGLLEGKYHICIDDTYEPVQHAPRRVSVVIRDKLKQTLEHLAQQGIITPVTEPTDWISSMVAVTKKNGMLFCVHKLGFLMLGHILCLSFRGSQPYVKFKPSMKLN